MHLNLHKNIKHQDSASIFGVSLLI